MKMPRSLVLLLVCCLATVPIGVSGQPALRSETSFTTLDSAPSQTNSASSAGIAYTVPVGEKAERLAAIAANIEPISHKVRVRRNIAQATFCLPQNIVGILFHGLLQAAGFVVERAKMNEVTIVITNLPIGVSFGKTIFLHTSLQTENAIRHEYGHTMQGYRRGPFFLLCEGAVSFAQAILSVISPSFADGYFERWPEDEANMLGGLRSG